VAELHREPPPRREVSDEGLDQGTVVMEGRRALEQDASELVPQELGELQEVADVLVGVGQPFEVGDPLVRLQREREALGGLFAPRRQGLLRGEAPERVVDLYRRQLARVVGQHLAVLQALRVEDPVLPAVEGEPGGAEMEAAGHRVHHGMR
jgi:hypothetical protein